MQPVVGSYLDFLLEPPNPPHTAILTVAILAEPTPRGQVLEKGGFSLDRDYPSASRPSIAITWIIRSNTRPSSGAFAVWLGCLRICRSADCLDAIAPMRGRSSPAYTVLRFFLAVATDETNPRSCVESSMRVVQRDRHGNIFSRYIVNRRINRRLIVIQRLQTRLLISSAAFVTAEKQQAPAKPLVHSLPPAS